MRRYSTRKSIAACTRHISNSFMLLGREKTVAINGGGYSGADLEHETWPAHLKQDLSHRLVHGTCRHTVKNAD